MARRTKPSRRKARKPFAGAGYVLDARRGTRLWSFNYFRSIVLTRLLDDLYNLEKQGLPDEYCQQILAVLNYFGNAATDIPSAPPFLGPIYQDIEQFTRLYERWNAVKGVGASQTQERAKLRLKLKYQRQRITDKARRLQVAIDQNMDMALLQASYQALKTLIAAAPDLFRGLSKALEVYVQRGGIL